MKHLKTFEDNNIDKIIDISHYKKLANEIDIKMSEDFNNIVISMKFDIGVVKQYINKTAIDGKHKIMVLPVGHKTPSFYRYMKDEEFDELKELEIYINANKYNI